MNTSVDNYFLEGCGRCSLGGTPDCKVHKWVLELAYLRNIVNDFDLKEESKWGFPCYTFQDSNVLLLSAFKDFCSLSFFKGVLLNNSAGILVKPGANSQATRLMKFTSIEEVVQSETKIRSILKEAIEVEKLGLKVEFKKNPEPMPEELEQRLNEDPSLRNAFESLTPGRQRGYILYFSAPKQSKTRVSRIEKSVDKILNGEGMHDKYSGKKK